MDGDEATKKHRPSDGSENNELSENELKAQKTAEEERQLERFVAEAEKDADETNKQKKKDLERMKASRQGRINKQEYKDYIQEIYARKNSPGFFNNNKIGKNGAIDNFYNSDTQAKIIKALNNQAKNISKESKMEALDEFNRFHKFSPTQIKAKKEEWKGFISGMLGKSSSEQFKKFRQKEIEEGRMDPQDISTGKKIELRKISRIIEGKANRKGYAPPSNRIEQLKTKMARSEKPAPPGGSEGLRRP